MRVHEYLKAGWRPSTIALTVSVALVTVTWWQLSDRMADASRTRIGNSLERVLNDAKMRLDAWVYQEQMTATLWAESPDVLRLTQELLQAERSQESLQAAPPQQELRQLLQPVIDAHGYRGFFVISKENESLASMRDSNAGSTNVLAHQAGTLTAVWEGETVVSLPQPSDVALIGQDGMYDDSSPTMFVTAPIRDDGGQVIAALAFRINPFKDFAYIFQQSRIGSSGETYAVNGDGVMISDSRFDRQLKEVGLIRNNLRSLLNVRVSDPGINLTATPANDAIRADQPLTVMASSATAGNSGRNLLGYPDYRGVSVIGVWLWDDKLQMGLTTEIDVDEAYQELWANQAAVSGLVLLSLLLLAGLTMVANYFPNHSVSHRDNRLATSKQPRTLAADFSSEHSTELEHAVS